MWEEIEKIVLAAPGAVSRVHVPNAAARRILHQQCIKRNWAHVSFHDPALAFDTYSTYRCPECRVWISEGSADLVTKYCCGDGDCGDYSIFCTRKGTDEEQRHAVWNQDGHEYEEFKRRRGNTNNVLAISVHARDLHNDFARAGISAGKAANWMSRRERKLQHR